MQVSLYTRDVSMYELVSRASRNFLYFWWEEQEGDKNTSGHSGQLSMPQRDGIIVFQQLQVMCIKTFIRLFV